MLLDMVLLLRVGAGSMPRACARPLNADSTPACFFASRGTGTVATATMRRAAELDFRVLGPLELRADGEPLPLGGAQPRAVLALLLVNANAPVSADRIVDALWGETPPRTARTALQTYIGRLRTLLEPDRRRRQAGELLVTRPPGYELRVPAGALDRDRFEALAAEGREALAGGRAAEAAARIRSALELWRGPALAEFADEPWARAEAERLEELRVACLEERIEADLRLGHDDDLVGELQALVAEHPSRERLRGQLMLALYRAGRQSEALEEYRRAREALVDELGLDPGPELRQLEAAILRQDEALAAPAAQAPTNLPAPPTPLVGRGRELADAERLLLEEGTRLLTLTGAGGSGKTRLALALAGRSLPRFADGAFLCELAAVSEPDVVVGSVAQALGVETGSVPALQRLQQVLHDRELLLVLDNLEQVLDVAPALAQLLASCPRLRIIATSRTPLHVRAEREYPVGPLAADEAAELFRQRSVAVLE
jgi:DNA-binding SARP family transcriptional activator